MCSISVCQRAQQITWESYNQCWLRGRAAVVTCQICVVVSELRPSGYESDQKENIWPLYFNDLRANPLISLDYLAALNRNRRTQMQPKP